MTKPSARKRCSSCGAPCAACAAKEYADAKLAFHKKYRAILTRVAKALGLRQSEYKVRVNQGGVAIMGDVTLRTPHLYVYVSGHDLEHNPDRRPPEPRFMYRTSGGDRGAQHDGPNQWLPLAALEGDMTEALAAFRQLTSEAHS